MTQTKLAAFIAFLLVALPAGVATAGPTSLPDPAQGKALAEKLCINCHLVGTAKQEHAIADVPSFHEIASREGQSAGAIMGQIMLPKHPMPQIPLTKAELADLAAYILTLRDASQ